MGMRLGRQANDNDKEKNILGIIHVYRAREDQKYFNNYMEVFLVIILTQPKTFRFISII